jgi:HK97 family phage major capsid protein
MADNKLDLKDIQGIVEEGLKTTKANWDKEREADKKGFDEKVSGIMSDIEGKGFMSKSDVETFVKEKSEALEKEMIEIKKGGLGEKTPLGFKASMAKALQDNFENFNEVSKIKGNQVVQLKDITYSGNFPGMEDWRTEYRNDTIMIDRDTFHMRDIISVGSTSKDTIKYPKEGAKTGTGPASWGRAATIAATDPKPEFEPNFSVYSTPVEWIAGIMRLPVEMLADLPFLTSYLQNFARLELLEEEDDQILNGNGTSPQLDGVIPNASAYDGSKTVLIEQIIDANLRQLGTLNTAGTDVLLNPAEIVDIILNKASGSGEYDNPNGVVGVVNGVLNIAGLSVRKTNKITAGEFLLGNFNHAQIFQRLAPQLRFFEQDQDNVTKNLVTVRIEERLALAILKPSFVHYTPST